jgi:hypothetical protein
MRPHQLASSCVPLQSAFAQSVAASCRVVLVALRSLQGGPHLSSAADVKQRNIRPLRGGDGGTASALDAEQLKRSA